MRPAQLLDYVDRITRFTSSRVLRPGTPLPRRLEHTLLLRLEQIGISATITLEMACLADRQRPLRWVGLELDGTIRCAGPAIMRISDR